MSLRACLLVSLVVALSPMARAAPEDDVARYRALIEDGTEAFAQGAYAEALRAFEAAYAIEPAPRLLYNIAESLRQLERYDEARRRFQELLAEVGDAHELAPLATEGLRAIEGAEAQREREPEPAPEPAEPAPAAAVVGAPPSDSASSPVLFYAGLSLFAVAGAAGVWSGIELDRARTISREIDAIEMDTAWNRAQEERYAEGERSERRGIILAGVGAGALVGGIVLLVLRGSSAEPESESDAEAERITIGPPMVTPIASGAVLTTAGRF